MNHLLQHITWPQYLYAALTITILYYMAVILRCYRPELQKLKQRLSGNDHDDGLQALRYQAAEEDLNAAAHRLNADQASQDGADNKRHSAYPYEEHERHTGTALLTEEEVDQWWGR